MQWWHDWFGLGIDPPERIYWWFSTNGNVGVNGGEKGESICVDGGLIVICDACASLMSFLTLLLSSYSSRGLVWPIARSSRMHIIVLQGIHCIPFHPSFCSSSHVFRRQQRRLMRGDDIYHYITYIPIDGYLWELDGFKRGPLRLGRLNEVWGWVANCLHIIFHDSILHRVRLDRYGSYRVTTQDWTVSFFFFMWTRNNNGGKFSVYCLVDRDMLLFPPILSAMLFWSLRQCGFFLYIHDTIYTGTSDSRYPLQYGPWLKTDDVYINAN